MFTHWLRAMPNDAMRCDARLFGFFLCASYEQQQQQSPLAISLMSDRTGEKNGDRLSE